VQFLIFWCALCYGATSVNTLETKFPNLVRAAFRYMPNERVGSEGQAVSPVFSQQELFDEEINRLFVASAYRNRESNREVEPSIVLSEADKLFLEQYPDKNLTVGANSNNPIFQGFLMGLELLERKIFTQTSEFPGQIGSSRVLEKLYYTADTPYSAVKPSSGTLYCALLQRLLNKEVVVLAAIDESVLAALQKMFPSQETLLFTQLAVFLERKDDHFFYAPKVKISSVPTTSKILFSSDNYRLPTMSMRILFMKKNHLNKLRSAEDFLTYFDQILKFVLFKSKRALLDAPKSFILDTSAIEQILKNQEGEFLNELQKLVANPDLPYQNVLKRIMFCGPKIDYGPGSLSSVQKINQISKEMGYGLPLHPSFSEKLEPSPSLPAKEAPKRVLRARGFEVTLTPEQMKKAAKDQLNRLIYGSERKVKEDLKKFTQPGEEDQKRLIAAEKIKHFVKEVNYSSLAPEYQKKFDDVFLPAIVHHMHLYPYYDSDLLRKSYVQFFDALKANPDAKVTFELAPELERVLIRLRELKKGVSSVVNFDDTVLRIFGKIFRYYCNRPFFLSDEFQVVQEQALSELQNYTDEEIVATQQTVCKELEKIFEEAEKQFIKKYEKPVI